MDLKRNHKRPNHTGPHIGGTLSKQFRERERKWTSGQREDQELAGDGVMDVGGDGCVTALMSLRPLNLFPRRGTGRHGRARALHMAAQFPRHPQRAVLCAS